MRTSRANTVGSRPSCGRDGFALGMVLIIVLLVALMGAGLVKLCGANRMESQKWVSANQAFWNAEAGLQEALARGYKNRTVNLEDEMFPLVEPRCWTGATARGTYEVTIIQDHSFVDPAYEILSEGVSRGGAIQAVRLTASQVSAISVGIMGIDELNVQPGAGFYSYDSSGGNTNPVPGNSTAEASVGSNEEINIQPGVSIDGTVCIGADEYGNPAEYDGDEHETQEVGYIDPDPLGAADGWLADQFEVAESANNNNSCPAIKNNELIVTKKQSATISSGRYFLTAIDLTGELKVDAGSGPVEIFLIGPCDASSPQPAINFNGLPTDFIIYSNSPEPIVMKPKGDFVGYIYAPFADVTVYPNGDFLGALWGGTVDIKPGGICYVDTALLGYTAFGTYRIVLNGWEQVGRMW